jgi:L-ascorbate metabolism protein UlaG (beta-lactamase superfamily)
MPTLTATLVGGPTAVLDYAGLRWVTDPALSPPGEYDHLVKTTGPALDIATLEPIDTVLLSHDQHADNLDPAGRELLPRAERVLTTTEGAQRLGGNALGLAPWETTTVGDVTVTAVPAQHGPYGCEPVTGPVTGFVLAAEGAERVYVSGDNASIDIVREIARRLGSIPVAVLFTGAVQVPIRFDGAYLTLTPERAAEAAIVLGARAVVPVHFEGWTHFTQGADALRAAFAGNGITDRLVLADRGETVSV